MTTETREQDEQQTERQYKIRQITHIQASWTEGERGEDGAFTLQLILDNGVDEYILRPTEDDLDGLLKLFKMSDYAMFDMNRKIVIFNNLAVK